MSDLRYGFDLRGQDMSSSELYLTHFEHVISRRLSARNVTNWSNDLSAPPD
jgi:hypothetical protein